MQLADIQYIRSQMPDTHLVEIIADNSVRISTIDYDVEFLDSDEMLKVTSKRFKTVIFTAYEYIQYMHYIPLTMDHTTKGQWWMLNYNHIGL